MLLYLAAAYLFALVFNTVDEDDPHYGHRLFLGFLALNLLWFTASYQGTIYAQTRILNADPDMRLLLTPDASELGLRGLQLSAGKQCLVSEPVSLVAITDDEYYLLLPNRTTMGIRKDKVIGTVIVRNY
jgi:hypothetical protein